MNTQDNERADGRLVFIGGEGGLHRITASGNPDPEKKQALYFFETEDWRYSWADWDGMLDAATLEHTTPLGAGEVVGIAQLTADAEGRCVLDRDSPARGEYMAVVWSEGGEQNRLVIELRVERLPPETRAANWARIEAESRGEVEIQRQKEREAANMAAVLEALNRHDEEARLAAERQTAALGRIEKVQQEMKPYVEGVPKLVEDSKETIRQSMAEFYRRLYAPKMTARQKAIADAMREAKNVVREAARILQLDSAWRSKGVSASTISRELDKMDKLFEDAKMPNPFASREHNRRRPVAETTYGERRIDSDDPDSAVEIVPNRPGGYGSDEADDETP